MGKSKHRAYEKEDKDGEVSKLKERIRKLEKENNQLKSEIRTLESAFDKTKRFLKGSMNEFSVEDAIEAAKKDKTLKEMKTQYTNFCPKCGGEIRVDKLPFGSMVFCLNEECKHHELRRKE